MFDFEKLAVYKIANDQNIAILKLIYGDTSIDRYLGDQWKRATLSITFNLAEGTGRVSVADKKHFYTMARSSVLECVAIIRILKGCQVLEQSKFDEFYDKYEQISKILLALHRKLGVPQTQT